MLHTADEILKEDKQHWVPTTFITKIKSGIPAILEPEKCDEIGWFDINDLPTPLSQVTIGDIEEYKK